MEIFKNEILQVPPTGTDSGCWSECSRHHPQATIGKEFWAKIWFLGKVFTLTVVWRPGGAKINLSDELV